MRKAIGQDFDLGLDTKKVITGYSALKLKYQKPLPEDGGEPETDFIVGAAYGTGTLKIKVSVPQAIWDTAGRWEFITWVEFADGRVLKGDKPFVLECTDEFGCGCST